MHSYYRKTVRVHRDFDSVRAAIPIFATPCNAAIWRKNFFHAKFDSPRPRISAFEFYVKIFRYSFNAKFGRMDFVRIREEDFFAVRRIAFHFKFLFCKSNTSPRIRIRPKIYFLCRLSNSARTSLQETFSFRSKTLTK